MQLTTSEIAYVKQFVIDKKYIYVEEQVEILDHFISLLEDGGMENDNAEFKALVSSVYEENKTDLLSIKKSVRANLKKAFKKEFLKNMVSQFTLKYFSFFLLGAALYFWFLVSIKDHISILTVSLPFFVLIPLSVVDCRRNFTLVKANFLTNRIAFGFIIWWTAIQLFPCNVLIHLGINGSIGQFTSFILISLTFMVEAFLFRAFIQTILAGARNCKMMEENYQLTNA